MAYVSVTCARHGCLLRVILLWLMPMSMSPVFMRVILLWLMPMSMSPVFMRVILLWLMPMSMSPAFMRVILLRLFSMSVPSFPVCFLLLRIRKDLFLNYTDCVSCICLLSLSPSCFSKPLPPAALESSEFKLSSSTAVADPSVEESVRWESLIPSSP